MFSVAIELGGADATKHYAPLAVSPALRGFAVEGSQLRLPGAHAAAQDHVSITALAARWCPTGRDLYLPKRRNVHVSSWERNVLGKVVDSLLVQLHLIGLNVLEDAFETEVQDGGGVDIDAAAAAIREQGQTVASNLLAEWEFEGGDKAFKNASLDHFAESMAPHGGPQLVDGTARALFSLVDHETGLLQKHIKQREAAGGDWMAEVRATLTRLQTGLKLDSEKFPAKVFGVTSGVRPDFVYAVTLVGDLKVGPHHEFYDTVATGYVIFAEYVLQRRINTAAILAVDLDLNAGSVKAHEVRVIHPDNDLRTRWLAQRDSALQTYGLADEPRHPVDTAPCKTCPYRPACWVGGEVDGTPIIDGQPRPTGPGGSA